MTLKKMLENVMPQPMAAQAAAARLSGDETSIRTVQFPVSEDPILTLLSGIQAVLETAGPLTVMEMEFIARWITQKATRKADPGYPSQAYASAGMKNVTLSAMGTLSTVGFPGLAGGMLKGSP